MQRVGRVWSDGDRDGVWGCSRGMSVEMSAFFTGMFIPLFLPIK